VKRTLIIFTLLTALLLTSCSSGGIGIGGTSGETDTPLVIAYDSFDGKFSPFYADTVYDRDAAGFTMSPLLTVDRAGEAVYNAIEGETREYNGTFYTYTGIADIDVVREDETTVYRITLRDDIVFSDGEKADADDIIFNYYVYCDPSYTGSSTISSYAIVGLDEYRSGSAPNISGIVRVDDYTVEVTTHGYEAPAVYSLCGFELAPLHHYGDEDAYDYENNSFGHAFGDLSPVIDKTRTPLGSGPYRFDGYRNKVVYLSANELYYKGEPKIGHIQLRETSEADKVNAIETGSADIAMPAGSKTRLDRITALNGGKGLSGDVITTLVTDNPGYGYIGINCETVKVGDDPSSEASKNLRKGLAAVLAVYRRVAVRSYYGDSADVLEYPMSSTSWAAPRRTDPDYAEAYSFGYDGRPLYTASMTEDERYAAALGAAVEYLKAAGYTYDESLGRFTAAPDGASLEYEVMIAAGGSGDHPAFGVLASASGALEKIGIELEINDVSDAGLLWKRIDAGTQELWSAAWAASYDPDMYQIYHSTSIVGRSGSDSNHYRIADTELDSLISAARLSDDREYRRTVYKACLDIIADHACEIPVYQRRNITVFSAKRINTATLITDTTAHYDWTNGIEKLEMNGSR